MLNLPNLVTLSRLLGLPLIFWLWGQPDNNSHWWGLGVFLVAASTDWLDGYLARRLNQITELGKFLDPLVDKLLVLGPLLILVQGQRVPAWVVFIILARELAIAGWRVNPQLTGESGISGANLWGKLKTVAQIIAIAWLLAPLEDPWAQAGPPLLGLAVVLTVLSGLIYVWPTSLQEDS
ncbi:CDP-diacylglycerol--glycerol-3-phosphate 3-phosphatidyltransferase [Synechocystis sp. LKSZ1]|uniref:CDP-diacylglycerol--glycerol-3-phosphate 3-phosphatidyltransferase n=1 Tax=Synechocystis sp. LKSZ1 TaxID=3144951 RepID=UPI00336BC079